MKLLASAILLGAATTTAYQPFRSSIENTKEKPLGSSASTAWDSMNDALNGLDSESRAAWEAVSMLFPDAMKKANVLSSPKPHTRKPDSAWDYVVKGADVQDLWVENTETGLKERAIHGKLENFNLRAKKVDPVKLGVDTVKQYSGYLDNEEDDKHLFYCGYSGKILY